MSIDISDRGRATMARAARPRSSLTVPSGADVHATASAMRGAVLMLCSCACFAFMIVSARNISSALPAFEIAFFRNAFAFMFLAPWLLQHRVATFRTERFGLHLIRASSGLAAMVLLFSALSLMPISGVTALSFTTPLFGTLGAALILRETVVPRRWAAVMVGFLGALIIVQPGLDAFRPVAFVALGSAAWAATAAVALKRLSSSEPAIVILFWFHLLTATLGVVPMAYAWVTPNSEQWMWLILTGLSAAVAQILLTRAFASADLSLLLPLDFSQLIFVAILGFLFFSEVPDAAIWIGGAFICASSAYSATQDGKSARLPMPDRHRL